VRQLASGCGNGKHRDVRMVKHLKRSLAPQEPSRRMMTTQSHDDAPSAIQISGAGDGRTNPAELDVQIPTGRAEDGAQLTPHATEPSVLGRIPVANRRRVEAQTGHGSGEWRFDDECRDWMTVSCRERGRNLERCP
jgi:hypothetical protein